MSALVVRCLYILTKALLIFGYPEILVLELHTGGNYMLPPGGVMLYIISHMKFYEKATVSVETEQLYRKNQEKGSCRFTIY